RPRPILSLEGTGVRAVKTVRVPTQPELPVFGVPPVIRSMQRATLASVGQTVASRPGSANRQSTDSRRRWKHARPNRHPSFAHRPAYGSPHTAAQGVLMANLPAPAVDLHLGTGG